jgi:hypothetical protein
MSEPGPFLSEQHPSSRRHAIFEDDGTSAWLYLTAPDEPRPVADVFVYNRQAPTDRVDESERSRPPPIVKQFAAPGAVVDASRRSVWRFKWSADGNSVALVRDGVVVALIPSGRRRGYSSAVIAECPWGAPLRDEHLAAAGLREAATEADRAGG